MGPGKDGSFGSPNRGRWRRAAPGLCLWLLAGCACGQQQFDQALLACRANPAGDQVTADRYTVACPDVLEWTVDARTDLAGRQAIGPDGCLDLAGNGRVRVEGQTITDVARSIADQDTVARSSVHVQVAEFRSQQIFLFGEVTGLQRTVPYRGEETLLSLLQRAGGITAGASPNQVYVVRTEVADGKQPEVFHIALKEIVQDQNQRTNIRLQPFDQVYIGETRQSNMKKCVPPCLRPCYQALCGLRRAPAPAAPAMIFPEQRAALGPVTSRDR
jgi:protein involved in polysaccharide export with SLBB domain